MSETTAHISLTCIYARKDAFIQQQLSSHLESLHLAGYLDAVQFMEVSEQAFAERRYTQEVREGDLYLILLSPHLMATPFIHSAFLRRMVAAHQYRQLMIVPLVIADGNYQSTMLGKLKRLNANRIPVMSESEFSLEAGLSIIAGELKLVAVEWRDQKKDLESQWLEARQEDKLQYYSNFLKDHPHSIYRELAQKRFDELKELDLWQTAKAMDKVHQYYLYLRDAPLQKKRAEALQRIAEIEKDEGIAREDALQSESLALLFDYKVRFPRGGARAEIEERIKKLAEERANHLDEPEYIQSEAYYLEHLAYEKLNQDELLSMQLLLDYNLYLIERSRLVSSNVSNAQISMVLTGFFGFMVGLYYLRPLLSYAIDGALGFRPFATFLICILGFFLGIRSITGFLIASRDMKFCRLTVEILERTMVAVKIASIDHDQRAVFQETDSLLRIDTTHKKLIDNSVLTYLFDRSPQGSRNQAEVIKKLPLPLKG